MRIPKKFKLMGHTISVEYDPTLHYRRDAYGLAEFRMDKIILQPSTEQTPVSQEMLEHVFCHELVHFLLLYSGEDKFDPALHENEALVDRIGGLLHQVLSSAKY